MATIVPLTNYIADGDFTFPVEVEGSPMISTDEVTKSLLITRTYAVYTANYVPTTAAGIVDPRYTTAYLVNETPVSIQGPILFFNRNFAQIPLGRVESRTIAFTRPGVSATQQSNITGRIIGWNQYGKSAPYTANVVAQVTYSYGLSATPSTPALTRILYSGSPVDYVGFVFSYVGNQITIKDGEPVTEPHWMAAGQTSPSSIPGLWIVEANVRRWRGPIFETEVVRVST